MEAINEMIFTGESPFKFLDPYSEEEQEHLFFFGREDEENELYDYVKRTKVLLLYGISGSGKTSLLQCGLSHKFRMSSGWIPVFIRRGNNINDSFRETLRSKMNQLLGGDVEEDRYEWEPDTIETDKDILQSLKLLYGYTLRPAFLVFDQFEEFVLMAEKEEQEKFVATLRYLYEARKNPYFNIIILMREEYFGPFDTIMKDIPGIADWRMRLSPLKEDKVIEVIEKLLTYFNITLQDKENDLQRIYNALRNKKGEVSLSNLQIYLDQFWQQDFQREYADGFKTGWGFPPLEFTTREIEEFGTIDVVLQRFLQVQKISISSLLKQEYHEPDDFLNRVLNELIGEEGNKKPVKFKIKNGYYKFEGVDTEKLNGFNKDALKYTLELLQEKRIVRIKEDSVELVHDSLAKLIYDVRDARYKKQIRIRQRLKAIDEGAEDATKKEVYGWEEYMDDNFFTDEEMTFYLFLKQEKEEKQLRARVKKNVVKAVMWMLGAVSALIIFYRVERVKDRQDAYAVNFIRQLDTVRNGREAMMLAKYLYDGLNDTSYRKTIQDKMLQLAAGDNFQRQFLRFEYSLTAGDYGRLGYNMRYPLVMLSDNGSFLMQNLRISDDTSSSRMVVYSSQGADTIVNAYGFPVSKDGILLYDDRLQTLNLCSYTNIETPTGTYNWNPAHMGFVNFEINKPFELEHGKYIIPYSDRLINLYFDEVNGFWLIDFSDAYNSRRIIELPDGYNCNDFHIEKDLVFCSAVDAKNDRWILVYDTSGKLNSSIRVSPDDELMNFGIYSSRNGKIAYTLNESLFVSADKGSTFKQYLWPQLDFGYEFILNLENDSYIKDSGSLVSQFDLSGNLLQTVELPLRIRNRKYDYKKDQICFESITDSSSGKQYLYIVDADLKLIAAYPKISGSYYYQSDNGNAIATFRNNSIFVYPVPGELIAFPDFSTLNDWLNKQRKEEGGAYKVNLESLKKKYLLKRPGFWAIN